MEKRTVLIVEDDLSLANAIEKKLKEESFDSLKARSVSEAFGLLEKNDVCAVWLDHYLLGDEDGLDFVVKLKEGGSRWKNIPVFVVSNTAGSEKIKSYLELSVERYYVKAETSLFSVCSEIREVINQKM